MTVTASHRRPHSHLWTWSINGQAETAIIVAHSREGKKGRRIQNEAAMRPTMNSTERLDRVRSRCGVGARIGRFIARTHRLRFTGRNFGPPHGRPDGRITGARGSTTVTHTCSRAEDASTPAAGTLSEVMRL